MSLIEFHVRAQLFAGVLPTHDRLRVRRRNVAILLADRLPERTAHVAFGPAVVLHGRRDACLESYSVVAALRRGRTLSAGQLADTLRSLLDVQCLSVVGHFVRNSHLFR